MVVCMYRGGRGGECRSRCRCRCRYRYRYKCRCRCRCRDIDVDIDVEIEVMVDVLLSCVRRITWSSASASSRVDPRKKGATPPPLYSLSPPFYLVETLDVFPEV